MVRGWQPSPVSTGFCSLSNPLHLRLPLSLCKEPAAVASRHLSRRVGCKSRSQKNFGPEHKDFNPKRLVPIFWRPMDDVKVLTESALRCESYYSLPRTNEIQSGSSFTHAGAEPTGRGVQVHCNWTLISFLVPPLTGMEEWGKNKWIGRKRNVAAIKI